MKRLLILVCLCLTALIGCSEKQKDNSPTTETQTAAARPSLTIGLIPERNIFTQLDRYEPVADYLSRRIGADIRLKVLTRYGNIIDNFVSAGLDGAFFGSFSYALAHVKLGVEPIARPEMADGTSTYYGMIMVRKDEGIKTAQDMKGKVFAFVDRATTAGYLLPLAYFEENGIDDYRKFLGETYFAGTHEAAIYDLLDKRADICAAKNTVFARLAARDKRLTQELVVLARSPDVPENGLAIRKDFDGDIKSELKKALLTMDKDPEGVSVLRQFGAKRFIETTNADYAGVYKYVKQIGLNLSTYNYRNQ
ncbi:MAG: phosphate/phosphite/phosphonate ABC transporter substrate-binding protein [Deltaproteobacteria bacterium]|nr:phosphate/phosphite/phosphonate ABC transporter substrate-binding protein [Deltaproteobacteria bacterium]